MRVTEDVMLREIAGETVLIPVGKLADEFRGIMSLNETGRFLWQFLQKGTEESELIEALLDEYETDRETAACDVSNFIMKLREHKLLV